MSSHSLIIYGDKVETFELYYWIYTTFINFKFRLYIHFFNLTM